MPMEKEKHENLLNELINPELTHTRRTEILQELRVDYGTVLTDHVTMTETNTKLQADNQDLIISNSKLFRQIGIQNDDTKKKDDEQKNFSETITIEQLEKK